MINFLRPFTKYHIDIETADGKKRCILGGYLDLWFKLCRMSQGLHAYEFHEYPDDE